MYTFVGQYTMYIVQVESPKSKLVLCIYCVFYLLSNWFQSKIGETKEIGKNRMRKMVLKASLIILGLFQALTINAAPKPEDYEVYNEDYSEDDNYYYNEDYYEYQEGQEFGLENICVLPKELGSSGKT